jgi:hypothetical protein
LLIVISGYTCIDEAVKGGRNFSAKLRERERERERGREDRNEIQIGKFNLDIYLFIYYSRECVQ